MSPAVRSVALTGANQQVALGPGYYAGFAVDETAGAVAKVRIWDGTSATGTLLDVIDFAAHGSNSEMYHPQAWFVLGVFVEVVSGTVAGSIRLG